MFQRIDKCTTQVSAQLFIEHGVVGNKKSTLLWAFGPTVGDLAGKIQVTARHLILRPMFNRIEFEKDVITKFAPNQPDM